jgi:glycosyltransferase involved in cell wall biosynthesis
MKIIGMVRTNSGVDYHRIFNPLRYLPITKDDLVILLNENSQHREEFFEAADILYLNRHLPYYSIEDLEKIKNHYNLKLVVDLDDYWELYRHHIIYRDWVNGKMKERIQATLKMADLVIVTHEKLANECKQFNERVEIFPNALPIGHDQFVYNPENESTFNIIYVGGNSHLSDLDSIGNLFRKLGSDGNFKNKAKVLLAGYNNPTNDHRSVWHHIDTVVKKCNSYERLGVKPVAEYMEMYDTANLCIAPLENNTFNSFKSNLKTVEAGCKHLPIIASNMHPYNLDANIQGVTLCNSVAEWYKAVSYYVNNPSAAEDDGDALFQYVNENYNLITQNKWRYELLKSLL